MVIEEIELEKLQLGLSFMLTEGALKEVAVEVEKDSAMRAICVNFVADVLAEQLVGIKKKVEFNYPNGWFQMLKEQYFPNWLLYRFPVKEQAKSKTVSFTKYATYPRAKIKISPELGGVVYKVFSNEI